MRSQQRKIILNLVLIGILIFFSALFIIKGIQLKTWTPAKSETSVSIHLLGFELFSAVPLENVRDYGNGFLITSVLALILCIFPAGTIMRTLWKLHETKQKEG